METDELEDLYVAVLDTLRTQVGEQTMRKWGYLTIKDNVRDCVEQGIAEVDEIVKCIREESELLN